MPKFKVDEKAKIYNTTMGRYEECTIKEQLWCNTLQSFIYLIKPLGFVTRFEEERFIFKFERGLE